MLNLYEAIPEHTYIRNLQKHFACPLMWKLSDLKVIKLFFTRCDRVSRNSHCNAKYSQ